MSDNDLFDTARSAYITIEDLDGRLVLIWTLGIRKDLPGTKGPYDAAEAKYVILDGEPEGMITEVPLVVEDGLFSAGAIFSKLKHRVNGKPVLGRVDSRPSKANKKVLAFGLAEPTAEDIALATAWLKANPQNVFA